MRQITLIYTSLLASRRLLPVESSSGLSNEGRSSAIIVFRSPYAMPSRSVSQHLKLTISLASSRNCFLIQLTTILQRSASSGVPKGFCVICYSRQVRVRMATITLVSRIRRKNHPSLSSFMKLTMKSMTPGSS